jgi:hypothetical protein
MYRRDGEVYGCGGLCLLTGTLLGLQAEADNGDKGIVKLRRLKCGLVKFMRL